MVLCKACNTRFQPGMSACPNCGRRVFASLADGSKSSSPPLPLASSSLADEAPDQQDQDTAVDVEVDVDLEGAEGLVEALDGERRLTDRRRTDRRESGRRDDERRDHERRDSDRRRSDGASRRRTLPIEPGPAVFHLAAAQVRTLVAEQPDLLESGLEILCDKKQQPVGVDYRTPVGAIDLLARDSGGDYVVVVVPDPRDVEALMPEVLARIGWVRKHLAGEDHAVRGIVVIEGIPEALAYAAAGVLDTLSFKTFRVALTFHDLEI